ncbi:MAG TPA: hypothetical protein VLT33_46460, partial [Labilithrix sp.]|nr:hypothetical protein [Labilithrix sp.]
SARQIAKALMETPGYVRQAEELWAARLHFEPAQVHGRWLVDADQLVAQMVTGRLGYDAFARRILAHPLFGVGARLPQSCLAIDEDGFYPQVAARALEVFLGRGPIGGEADSLAKLFRPWKKRVHMLNSDYGRADAVLDPSACPCTSTALGATTTIVLPLDGPTLYQDLPTDKLAAVQTELEKPGALLVAQEPFWTQAADVALAMYLGWWKSTLNVDASMLPDVQLALAQMLRDSPARSFKDLVLEVVTSELYVRSNRALGAAPDDLPVYCSGPLRLLRPEAYVSSLGALLEVRVGRCDHHTSEKRGTVFLDGTEGTYFPDELRSDVDSDATLLGTTDFHREAARAMGGCAGGAPGTEEPTLKLVFGAADVAETVCSVGAVLPAGALPGDTSPGAVQAIGSRLSRLLLGREATSAELDAFVLDAAPCSNDASCDARTVARAMCAAMARSIDFTTY